MPLPRDITQLALGLHFKPGLVDTAGLCISIAARMPEHYQQPTVFLKATLCDVTLEIHKIRLTTYRFIVDKDSYDNEPVRRTLASGRERLKQSYQSFGDDDPVKPLVRQQMDEAPVVWLEFDASEWIALMGDHVTVHSTGGGPEPLGEITQLSVLK